MAISSINRDEFEKLFPFDSELAPYIGKEVEWYVDDAKDLIGIIAKGNPSFYWSYTILKRNALGDFLVATLSMDFKDLQSARAACLQEMATPPSGQDGFPTTRD